MDKIPTVFKERAERFFGWWLAELLDCVPLQLRETIGARIHQLVVLIADRNVTFEHVRGKTSMWLGSLDLAQSSPAGQRETVREILKDAKLSSAQVVIRVPRSSALRRTVDLPSPALENLREVLSFEMDRHTPFESDEVYFDYHVTDHDRKNKQIKVDLLVISKEVATRAIELVSGWGLEPDKLALADRDEDEKDFNLLPRSTKAAVRGRPPLRMWIGAATAAMLLFLAVWYPLKIQRADLAVATDLLSKARANALEADNLTKTLESMSTRSRFVVSQKRDRYSITELMDEVTRRLPDDTWVLQLGRRGDQLTMSGYSVKPSALIGILEESALLEQVRFSSPVTADPRVGRDRFNISARVAQRQAR